MADSVRVGLQVPAVSPQFSVARVTSIPWYVWWALLAVTSTTFGLYWDISWHTGIGRDTFWTPAHLAIQFGAVLTGIACGYLILHTTLAGTEAERQASVRIWGFRGPLGAFIAAWGGFAMLTSAPFDNWWHDSFGLDVKILSPPHVLLILGIFAMGLGGLILLVGRMNLAVGETQRTLNWFLLYAGSLLLSLLVMLGYEYVGDQTLMHSAIFYRVLGMAVPLVLVGVDRASGHRWAATTVAAFYTTLWLAGLWIFPLFPAQAKLGPVFTQITHMVPLGFPILILPGAMAIDYALQRWAGRGALALSALAGCGFLAATILVQWPFASFLMTPFARNGIWGMTNFGYADRPSDYHLVWEFHAYEKTRMEFWIGMGIALLVTMVVCRIGLLWGDWMRRVKR